MLGMGVLNPYSAHPVELAMHAATLQELSGGRAILGIAAGAAGFLELAGISQDAPILRVPAKPCWPAWSLLDGANPAEVEGVGQWGQAARLLSVPAQEVPLYLGAMSPKMLALAASCRTGFCPSSSRPSITQRRCGGTSCGDGTRATAQPSPSISPPACGSQWPRTVRQRRQPWRTSSFFMAPSSPLTCWAGGAHSGRLRTGGGGAEQR